MKRLSGVLAVISVLCGCASFMPGGQQSTEQVAFTLDDPYNDGTIALSVVGFERGLLSVTGVKVEIDNKGEVPAVIKWSRSQIGQNGRTASPFLDGMRLEDADTPAPDERVKASSNTRRTLSPAYNVEENGDQQRLGPMYSIPILIRLCIQIGGDIRYYGITVDPSGKK